MLASRLINRIAGDEVCDATGFEERPGARPKKIIKD